MTLLWETPLCLLPYQQFKSTALIRLWHGHPRIQHSSMSQETDKMCRDSQTISAADPKKSASFPDMSYLSFHVSTQPKQPTASFSTYLACPAYSTGRGGQIRNYDPVVVKGTTNSSESRVRVGIHDSHCTQHERFQHLINCCKTRLVAEER